MFQFFTREIREQKIFSWASNGLLFFVFAFLWAPSRDGLQVIYALAFFLPISIILLFRKPHFNEYGGWPTVIALTYAGFSTFSSLWGEPKDFGFFVLQWCVLATWLCGSCLVFSKQEIDIGKYIHRLVILGTLITLISVIYYFGFVFSRSYAEIRMIGWNVFRNTNEIGAFCGIISLLAIIIAFQSSSLKKIWLFYLLAAVSSIGLITTFSRGPLVAFFIMTFIALTIIRPPLKVWLPPFLIFICAFVLILSSKSIDAFGGRGIHIGDRAILWQEVLKRSDENIFIGIGMDKNSKIVIPTVGVFNHAHNAWLDTLYHTGLIGLSLILLHLMSILKRVTLDSRILPLYLWLGYGCICNLVDGRCFFGEIGAKWFLYWIPVGLITASHMQLFKNIKVKSSRVENKNIAI